MATILSGGRVGRTTEPSAQPQQFNQLQAPQEESVESGITGKIARPAAKFGAAALGAPQDLYQTLESIVSNPTVQKAIVGPAAGLIDLLPGGKLPIPERIPFLPNSSEIKEKATEAGEPVFGKGFMQAEGTIENIIDRTAEFLPSALFASLTGGGSLLKAGVGALGSGAGAEIGSAFGAPGEFAGAIVGDVLSRNPGVIKKLNPKNIHSYIKTTANSLWSNVDRVAKDIAVPKETLSKITAPILAEEQEIIRKYPIPSQRDAETKATLNMLKTTKNNIDKSKGNLSDLMQARKDVNEYFGKNITSYQEQRAKYLNKLVREGIDEVVASTGNKDLAKDYNLANTFSKSAAQSDRIQKLLKGTGLVDTLKEHPAGAILGSFFAIPSLILHPKIAIPTAVASYGLKTAAPYVPYINPKLLPSLSDIVKKSSQIPFDKQVFARSVQSFIKQSDKITREENKEKKILKNSGPVILSGGRINRTK